MYVAYHMTADSTKFGGDGVIKYVLFYISDAYCIVYYNYSFSADYLCARLGASLDKHKKIARITFPIWLYVAVTGVVVYLMISPYYVR
jgi:putative membrane protein